MPEHNPDWIETVTLRDGSEVALRPVQPDDAPRLRALFHRLSPESIYLRFLEARKDLSQQQARAFATVDYQRSMAIVAAVPDADQEEKIIGVARYGEDLDDPSSGAETAVVVEDAYQGRGLGSLLLLRLVHYAREHGVKALRATVHQSNDQILRFVRRSGLPIQQTMKGGVWDITLSLTSGELPALDHD